jgi:hypothetical protein
MCRASPCRGARDRKCWKHTAEPDVARERARLAHALITRRHGADEARRRRF